MGSVIVDGGAQLSGGKSLVKPKPATLHFGPNEMSPKVPKFCITS